MCCAVLCVLASPAMRGSTPLDVAASSVMDNNGLALALEEPDLDKVRQIFAPYRVDLSSFCGQDSQTRDG